jgi:hypothetical protein
MDDDIWSHPLKQLLKAHLVERKFKHVQVAANNYLMFWELIAGIRTLDHSFKENSKQNNKSDRLLRLHTLQWLGIFWNLIECSGRVAAAAFCTMLPRRGHLYKESKNNLRRSGMSYSHKVTYEYNEISQWSVGVTSGHIAVAASWSDSL